MLIRIRRSWAVPGLQPTPEDVYIERRSFLKAAGFGGLSLLGIRGVVPAEGAEVEEKGRKEGRESGSASDFKPYPAARNEKYKPGRRLTQEKYVISYNNFYEFSFGKSEPKKYAQRMEVSPWKVEVTGLVQKPVTLDIDDMIRRFPLEERLYRFRCVEAWAMTVPWTGFPLRALVEYAKPLSSAKYVRFETFHKPEWGRGFQSAGYPWPYHEGLTIAEATNELTLAVTGLYGKPLPKQNGAPVRLIVPWKYGFKSIKSIVRIEFVKRQPRTFWNTVIPQEYDFWANVNPKVPHPRWSQASERLIDTGERVPTRLYNGYGEQVAGLYGR